MIRALFSRYTSVSITCAISSGDVFKSQSVHIPCGPEESGAAALGAAQAGAVAVLIHAREVGTGMSPTEFRTSLGPWRTSAPAPSADVESR